MQAVGYCEGTTLGEGSSLPLAPPFVPAPRLDSAGPRQGCTSSEPFPNSGTSASRRSSPMASAHLEAICARDEMHALCAGRWEFGRGGVAAYTHTRMHTHAHARTPSVGVGTWGHAPRRPRVQGSALPCLWEGISILSVSRAAQTRAAQDLLLCLATSFISSWEKQ